ncbi:lipocalin family protein [Salinimicrobium soli]|uniref:lipocalin family protein n=1 Tax=Salinimicrobium soli TaxID=1254399 RepID=UPI003AAE4E2D
MKKYLILFLAVSLLGFTSCSDDDDAGNPSLIATWTLVSVTPSQVYDLSACPNKPVITFNQDDTTDWTVYDPENNCQSSESSGEWQENTNGTYTVTIPDLGTFIGTVNFNGKNEFTFITSYNSFPVTLTFQR